MLVNSSLNLEIILVSKNNFSCKSIRIWFITEFNNFVWIANLKVNINDILITTIIIRQTVVFIVK